MLRLTLLSLLCLCVAANAAEPTATPAPVAEPSASPAASGSTAPAAPKITWGSAHVDGPYIAMTFDDGPSLANTPRLLDMLAQRHIKATFFLIGENIVGSEQNREKLAALVKRIHAEGHEIGNHSWTHPNLALLSDEKVHGELQQTDDAIYKILGFHPALMRPPYGSLSIFQRKNVNKEFGYKIIIWSVDPLDWKYLNAEHVENEILKGVAEDTAAGRASIILSHDIHATTVDAMPDTLDKLLAKGYKFVTVSELIAMDKPVPPKPSPDPAKKTAAAKPAASAAPAPAN